MSIMDKYNKKIWLVAGILAGCVVLYFALIYPFSINKKVTDALEIEEQRYNSYIKLISQRPKKNAILKQLTLKKEKYNNRLLDPDKPPVVAANLQNTLKEMASEEGVEIISEKQLTIIERDPFIEIPIEITLKCSITKLTNLIYDIEDFKKFLDISKINVRVVNIRNPIDVRADLTVSGFILAQDVTKEK
ncbi:MAG: type II secretion system protein GspM [bacterium]